MRVISKKALLDFIKRHPETRGALLTRYSLAQACFTYGYNDLKQTFAGMDYMPPHTPFSMWAATGSGSSRRFTTTGGRCSFVTY